MTTTRFAFLCATIASLLLPARAATVSTGDLGYNVVAAAGSYTWSPTISATTTALPATLEVTYGLWNDPGVQVHAYINGTEVGSFFVNVPYIDLGPSSNSFNISGLLLDGVNTVRFDGLGANEGEYVIGSITLHYNLPSTNVTEVPPDTNAPPVATSGHRARRACRTPGTGSGAEPSLGQCSDSHLQNASH